MPALLAVVITALVRAAEPAPIVVDAWQVPAGCPAQESLHAGIQRSLSGLPIAAATSVRVGVSVTREGEQKFRLRLALDAGEGPTERELAAESCAAAIDTAAWLIAVAIDVRAVDPASAVPVIETPPPEPAPQIPEPPPSSPPPAPAPAPVVEPEPEPVLPPASTHASRTPLHLDLWAGGGVGLGVLPRAAPTAALGLTLLGRRWETELSGHYWAVRRAEFGGGVGGRFVHGHVAARGCFAYERSRVRVSLCGGLAVGAITGEGTGALMPRTATSLWLGLLAGGGLRVRLHPRIGLLLRPEAVFGVRRPGFVIEPTEAHFRPSVVGFSAIAALVVRLR